MVWSERDVPSLGALAFAGLPQPALLFEPTGTVILVNEAWQSTPAVAPFRGSVRVGSRVEDLIRCAFGDAPAGELALNQLRSVLAGDRAACAFEIRQRVDDRPVVFGVTARRGPHGAEGFVVATVSDATAERLTADELRLRRAHWAAVGRAQDALGVGFVIVEHDRVVFSNDTFARLTGYTSAELLALPSVGDLADPDGRERWRGAFADEPAEGAAAPRQFEAALTHRSGAVLAVEVATNRVPLAGSPRTVGLVRDLTAQRENERRLGQANAELSRWVRELERRNDDIALLREMHHLLLASTTEEEAHSVVGYYLARLMPHVGGAMTVLDDESGNLEVTAQWGTTGLVADIFPRDRCWAIRLGQPHAVDPDRSALLCPHYAPLVGDDRVLCIPLTARGTALGVLHLRRDDHAETAEADRQLAVAAAEHVALALANLRLQSSLRNQSIRDSLTGLFNRRYLEETLERELRQATRHERSVGLIMVDVDRFKRVNDEFGHDAGDAVIREIGQLLRSSVRAGDIACRYGGEEFALVLPEASLEDTRRRAEQIREVTREHRIVYHGDPVGKFSVSLGVSACPEHGFTGQLLLLAADRALYRAKRAGGDRVIVAD